jgi:hypothetical protein
MVSLDTDWSSGASGIACEAEIAAKLRPIANADAARIFMDVPFCWQAVELRELNYANIVASDGLTTGGGASADAIPNDAGASGDDGANPNAFDASPNADDRANDVPSALPQA